MCGNTKFISVDLSISLYHTNGKESLDVLEERARKKIAERWKKERVKRGEN